MGKNDDFEGKNKGKIRADEVDEVCEKKYGFPQCKYDIMLLERNYICPQCGNTVLTLRDSELNIMTDQIKLNYGHVLSSGKICVEDLLAQKLEEMCPRCTKCNLKLAWTPYWR